MKSYRVQSNCNCLGLLFQDNVYVYFKKYIIIVKRAQTFLQSVFYQLIKITNEMNSTSIM